MTGPDESRKADVAEYVLGLLEGPEREAVARAIETDPALAAEAQWWQDHLAAFNADYAAIVPPAGLLARLEARLSTPEPARPHWIESLNFWRATAGLGFAAAVIGIGLNLLPLLSLAPTPPAPALVFALGSEGEAISMVALYDPQAGELRFVAHGAPAEAGHDYELWLVPAEGAPLSVGVIGTGTPHAVPLEAGLAGHFVRGAALAVSLEPAGGSPTGAPTGPVLAAGDSAPI